MLDWNSGFEKFCLEFGMARKLQCWEWILQLKLLWLSSSCFSARIFPCCCYGSWTIKFLSQEARRWGDWPCFGADQATKPSDPGIDASYQCPIATFTTSKYTSSSTYSRCPSKFSWPSRCFSNAPSNAPSKYPSACHLAFYKLLENMHNLWERSVLAKWVLHESNLHCNRAFNKLHFNALQFMF